MFGLSAGRPRLCPPAIALVVSITLPVVPTTALGESADGDAVDFNRDVRPILANTCYHCHGNDPDHVEAGLRLNSHETATEDLGGYRAIEPGDREASEAWLRMISDDADTVMPPPHSGKALSETDREVLGRWIDQGAVYDEHWAFTSPVAASPPEVVDPLWAENPIDAFVLNRLQIEGLQPNPPADRRTLIRRLSLDLLGLPPTREQVDAFVADDSPTAIEDLVDRLLRSPHHGEHWGRTWLDAARYADSDGYEKDKPRSVHFYRDWVVAALNDDMPYDEFVIRQVAGDLLPDATQDDRVATGFLRNSMINEEGGIDVEQFRMEAMYDRMDAIGKAVLGLTVQCAQCHTHKYDPISHNEYYSMFAMLNNSYEASITVYDPREHARLDDLRRRLSAIYVELLAGDRFAEQFEAWLDTFRGSATTEEGERAVGWRTPEIDWNETSISGQKYLRQSDGSYLQQGYAGCRSVNAGDIETDLDQVSTVRIDISNHPNLPHGGPGRSFDGTWALTELAILVSDPEAEGGWRRIPYATVDGSVNPPRRPVDPRYRLKEPDPGRVTGPVSFAADDDPKTAWTGTVGPGRRNEPQTATFTLAEPIVAPEQGPLRFRVEVRMQHGGWNSDDNQTHNLGRFRLSFADAAPESPDVIPPRVRQSVEEGELTDDSSDGFRRTLEHFVREALDRSALSAGEQALVADSENLWSSHPAGVSQLVMQEMPTPRKTHRLDRGDFLSPREAVEPGTPAFLHAMPDDACQTRLDLARWLVSEDSPTAARAIVNRIWQSYFGTGFTATADDLGLQGEPPTHPQLLDNLAVGLMESGWSLKWLHRQIVTSRTYQQSSDVRDIHLQVDPANRLLARGPRVRVSAETVRDIALAVGGLLNPAIGGPPVYPPAPMMLFEPPSSYGPKTWDTAEDDQRYRRSLYTFRFRSVLHPAMAAFDAPTGEISCVRRPQSNTPLQALVTLNEATFVDCAEGLAERTASIDDPARRIATMFEHCTQRPPSDAEAEVLDTFYRRRLENDDATTIDPWIAVARVILNLDEAVTKS